MEDFGKRLRKFREESLRVNKSKFAELVGTRQQYVGGWENGRSKLSHDNMELLRKTFPQLNMDWLETGKGHMLNMLISSEMSSVPDNNPLPIPKNEYINLVHSKEILSIKLDSANQKIDALSQVVDSKQKEIETLKILIENLK